MSRRAWLAAGAALPVFSALAPASLRVTWDGDALRVSAPHLRFLTGKPLERLKNGISVTFLSQLTVSLDAGRTVFRRFPERFVVSYDLWEEKFSVTRLAGAERSASHLTAEAVEAWCVESMAVSTAGIDPDRQLWLRLEIRAADPKEASSVVDDLGISITRLIEIFGRRARPEQPRWVLRAGPVRLADLRASQTRGARNG